MKNHLFALPIIMSVFLFNSCLSLKSALISPFGKKSPEDLQSFEYKMLNEKDSKYYLEYKISYPEFINNDVLNSEIKDTILSSFKKTLSTAKNDWNAQNEIRKITFYPEEPEPMPPFEYLGSTEHINITPNYVSIIFDEYIYLGGAHGSPVKESINYSKSQNKILSIEELSGLSLNRISRLCYDSLLTSLSKEKFSDLDWVQNGTEPISENYQVFTISEDEKTLTVYFTNYQVAQYSYGILAVKIEL